MSPVQVWYHVRDLDAGRAFYTGKLDFVETYLDEKARWARLMRGEMEIAIAEGEPQEEAGVARHPGAAQCLEDGVVARSAHLPVAQRANGHARELGDLARRV